jgi:glyoxylase-like metal-dependent hydrolase (beta-lactamase superfamily II)
VIVRADRQREAIVFDCGAEAERIVAALERLGVVPGLLVQTHCHGDHIAALDPIKARYPGAPLCVPAAEREWLQRPLLNLSMLMGTQVTGPEPDRLIADGDPVELSAIRLAAIHVPGHSPGGTAFYAAPADGGPLLIAGDILMAGGVGRTDFPGGSFEKLAAGIRRQLYVLPDETVIYPGHGPETTIGREKRSNPFVQG